MTAVHGVVLECDGSIWLGTFARIVQTAVEDLLSDGYGLDATVTDYDGGDVYEGWLDSSDTEGLTLLTDNGKHARYFTWADIKRLEF